MPDGQAIRCCGVTSRRWRAELCRRRWISAATYIVTQMMDPWKLQAGDLEDPHGPLPVGLCSYWVEAGCCPSELERRVCRDPRTRGSNNREAGSSVAW